MVNLFATDGEKTRVATFADAYRAFEVVDPEWILLVLAAHQVPLYIITIISCQRKDALVHNSQLVDVVGGGREEITLYVPCPVAM